MRQFLNPGRRQEFGFSGYCLSFAFMHFLFHAENEKHAASFRRFLAAGHYKLADFEKIVGEIEVIEPAFKKYVREFLLPGMIASQNAAQDNGAITSVAAAPETPDAAREMNDILKQKPSIYRINGKDFTAAELKKEHPELWKKIQELLNAKK